MVHHNVLPSVSQNVPAQQPRSRWFLRLNLASLHFGIRFHQLFLLPQIGKDVEQTYHTHIYTNSAIAITRVGSLVCSHFVYSHFVYSHFVYSRFDLLLLLAKDLYMDGTFQIAPRLFYQVFILFQGFSWLAGIHDFWFLQFQPESLTSIIINCHCFHYSAAVFFRAHLHTTLGILLLKYNNQVS